MHGAHGLCKATGWQCVAMYVVEHKTSHVQDGLRCKHVWCWVALVVQKLGIMGLALFCNQFSCTLAASV